MEKIAVGDQLKNSIKEMEVNRARSGNLMKQQFELVAEKAKPANIIKNTISNVVKSPDIAFNVLGLATGMATGFLTKKIVVGSSRSLIRKFLGTTLQLGVTRFISKHPDTIKSAVLVFLKRIRPKTGKGSV